MKRALVISSALALAASVRTPVAAASALRPLAASFGETAPDLETLAELFAPEPEADEEDRAEAHEKRQERIAGLEAVYKGSKSESSRAAALVELARLYEEHAFDVRDRSAQVFRAARDRFDVGETLAEPALALDAYEEARLKRVSILREFTANFPRDPRIGEMTWQLAAALAAAGNDHCERYFAEAQKLAKTPELRHKIALSRGDRAVALGHWDEAIAAYGGVRQAIKDEDDPLRAYAAYRLGWAFLGKAQAVPPAARPELTKKGEAALKLAWLAADDDDTRFKLKAETGKDLAWLWAVNGDDKGALAFADAQDEDALAAAFRARQADEWLRAGAVDKAAGYFRGLAAADPEDVKLPDYQLRLASAHVGAGNTAAAAAATAAITTLLTPAKEGAPDNEWLDEHEDDAEVLARAKRMVALFPASVPSRLFKAAMAQTDAARKKTMLTAAVAALSAQIRAIPDPVKSLPLRLSLLEGLRGLGRNVEVLDQLDVLARMGPKAGPEVADAVEERLELIIKLDAQTTYPPVPAPGEAKAALPLPDLKQRFAVAARAYLELVPDAENALNLRYQVALDLFNYGHYAQALPLFEAIVTDYPRSEQAKVAVEVCLSMNLKTQNMAEVLRLATAFLNNREVKGGQLRGYIKQNYDWAKAQIGAEAAH